MDSEEKKRLRLAIKTFYDFNHDKGKFYTFQEFKNWSAKSRDHLIRRIKKCLAKMDQSVITGMFDHLKDKIHKAKDQGLGSLV